MSAVDDLRRERRHFIRVHHPDRGGDPGYFVAGLARFDEQQPAGPPLIVFRPRPTWRTRVVAARRRVLGDKPVPRRVH